MLINCRCYIYISQGFLEVTLQITYVVILHGFQEVTSERIVISHDRDIMTMVSMVKKKKKKKKGQDIHSISLLYVN